MFAENCIKRAARLKERIKGVHLTFPAPLVIEIVADLAVDFIYLDGEHGAFDTRDVEACCIMAERHELTLVARVPDKHPETITRFLDRGVKGIIVPHVETEEEARRAAGACYYGPLGSRSFGASRPHGHLGTSDFPAYLAGCNEQISLSVMIESRTGLEAIAAIAAVEGVDYITFGLIDLAQSLGCPGQPSHPTVVAAVHEATECVRKAGKAIREDFMDVAWIPEIIRTGTRHLLKIST